MEQKTTLAQLRTQQATPIEHYNVGLTNSQGFELAQRAGKMLSTSTLVPKEYQGNLSNCIIALNMASRMGADPLMVMQNLVIVYGKPSWSSKFLIATVNTCGRFSALRFEYFGENGTDEWGCRAWAIEKSTGEKLVGPDITIALSKAEGWYGKSGSKWKTIPQKMLMYRSGGWWCDVYAPELSMGLRTDDENYDIVDIDKYGNVLDSVPSTQTTESLRRKRKDVSPTRQEPEAPIELETTTDLETGEIINVGDSDDELLTQDEYITKLKVEIVEWSSKQMSEKNKTVIDSMIAKNFAGATLETLEPWHAMLKDLPA